MRAQSMVSAYGDPCWHTRRLQYMTLHIDLVFHILKILHQGE